MLGIEGDTPRDTVATLVAQVRQLRSELQTALSDNKVQRDENQRLRQREGAIDQRIQSALDSERNQLQLDRQQLSHDRQQTQGLLQQLQQRLDAIGQDNHADLPVGLGLEPVSYTHLDVYKRQVLGAVDRARSAIKEYRTHGDVARLLVETAREICHAFENVCLPAWPSGWSR